MVLMACSAIASAQVYQSVDEQGNPVFSDRPSADSQAVKVPEPNLGKAVEVPPPPPAAIPEQRPEIEPDREPSDLDGELIGEKRDKKRKRRPVHPLPRGNSGGGR